MSTCLGIIWLCLSMFWSNTFCNLQCRNFFLFCCAVSVIGHLIVDAAQ
jgi:hypothetical protein